MVEIKICGLREPEAVRAAAGADWVGFNFYPPSPRFVTAAQAAELATALPAGGPKPVGLFVDPADAQIAEVLETVPLAVIQLHDVSPERAAEVQAKFGVPVWWVVGIATAADLPATAPPVTRLMLDRKPIATDPLPGGNAQPFNWGVLRGWAAPLPWVLAGGLTPDNVAAAMRETGAGTVDVSSGVERARGVKDPGLVRAFIEAVRAERSPFLAQTHRTAVS